MSGDRCHPVSFDRLGEITQDLWCPVVGGERVAVAVGREQDEIAGRGPAQDTEPEVVGSVRTAQAGRGVSDQPVVPGDRAAARAARCHDDVAITDLSGPEPVPTERRDEQRRAIQLQRLSQRLRRGPGPLELVQWVGAQVSQHGLPPGLDQGSGKSCKALHPVPPSDSNRVTT